MPYIDDILAEIGDAEFDKDKDIKEVIGGEEQPGGGDTFGLEVQEATLVYVFDWRKRRSFTRWMLGFSYADEGDPYRIRRENPQEHPSIPWLTAQTIHFSAIGPKANNDDGDPKGSPNIPAVFTSNDLKKTSYYDSVYATVKFVAQPWTFRPDDYVTDHKTEIERNTYFDPVPQVDLLQAEGGTAQLKYFETDPAGGATSGDVIGNAFATQVAKLTYNMHWMWVPESYLSSDNERMFSPANLMSCATMVNRFPFFGRKAGTMLMLAPQLQRFRFPIETFDGLYPFWGWNIRVPLVYFNPPKAIADSAAGYPGIPEDNIPRGHRCMPNRVSGKWVGARREDGKHYLLHERDLYNAFRHIADPDGPAKAGDIDPYD